MSEIIAGQSPPSETYRKTPEGLPFFQGKADFGPRHPIARTWCVAPVKIALPGDILISVRAPVGPTNIAHVKCCIGRGLAAIRCGVHADRDFVLAAMRLYEGQLAKVGSGSTFSAIKRDVLESLEIPLPPLHEQQHIAAILSEQMAAVERARAAAEARLEVAKALPGAYLRAVFNTPEAKGWPRKQLREACEVKGGKRLPSGTDFATRITPFPYLRVLDFHAGTVRLDGMKYLYKESQSQIERYIINRDDVYISIAGTIGLVGVIPDALHGANLTENAARLIIRDRITLHRDFLARFLQSPEGQESIRLRTNAVGQPKLALERIETIEVPLPSYSKQEFIGTIMKDQMDGVERVRKALEDELTMINALPAAVLRRAFNGEL